MFVFFGALTDFVPVIGDDVYVEIGVEILAGVKRSLVLTFSFGVKVQAP